MNYKIAFLGLGVMGTAMTTNLIKHGYLVKAWNRTADRPGVQIAKNAGAIIVSSIAEAVHDADYIFTCVGDVPDVKEVILGEKGVVKYAKSRSLVVDFSTIGSQAAQDIATVLKQAQIRFMDAPISGGDIGAQQGTLTIMVGGNEQDFLEVKPILVAMGKTIRLCGEIGSGQAVKMCNQVLAAVHMIALCEGLKMAEIQKIDPNLMLEICGTGAAGSWALSNLGKKIVESDLNPGFMIKHILKDLRLVQETTKNRGENLPGVELAEKLFELVSKMDEGNGSAQGTQAMIRAYLTTSFTQKPTNNHN